MAAKKITDLKEIEKKISELKIEFLKQNQKKRTIKKEIARLLTSKQEIMINKIKQGEKK
jgi:ribosomal protein L29